MKLNIYLNTPMDINCLHVYACLYMYYKCIHPYIYMLVSYTVFVLILIETIKRQQFTF